MREYTHGVLFHAKLYQDWFTVSSFKGENLFNSIFNFNILWQWHLMVERRSWKQVHSYRPSPIQRHPQPFLNSNYLVAILHPQTLPFKSAMNKQKTSNFFELPFNSVRSPSPIILGMWQRTSIPCLNLKTFLTWHIVLPLMALKISRKMWPLKTLIDNETVHKPRNFVRIVEGICPCGGIYVPNFVKFTVLEVPYLYPCTDWGEI